MLVATRIVEYTLLDREWEQDAGNIALELDIHFAYGDLDFEIKRYLVPGSNGWQKWPHGNDNLMSWPMRQMLITIGSKWLDDNREILEETSDEVRDALDAYERRNSAQLEWGTRPL
jgi:hypothetical protein